MSLPADVEQIDVVLGWTESEVEVDASALLLNSGGKVRSDEDFVFYNPTCIRSLSAIYHFDHWFSSSATREVSSARRRSISPKLNWKTSSIRP